MLIPEPPLPLPASLPPTAHRVAVFVDIENFAGYCADLEVPVDLAPVLARLGREVGRICIKRSFGDISSLPRPHFNPYEVRRMLQALQIEHIDIPHRPSSYSKNSADIRLVVEAVALIHQRPDITHLVVFSNDRDFIPLFNHAREHGKTVIGCGPARGRVVEDYVNACDHFFYHEDVVQPSRPVVVPVAAPVLPPSVAIPPASAPSPIPWAAGPEPVLTPEEAALATAWPALTPEEQVHWGRLQTTLHVLREEGTVAQASRLSLRMRELFPEFDAKQAFGSFKQFCLSMERTGRIRLLLREQPNFIVELGDPGGYVAPPAASEAEAGAVMPELLAQYRAWALRKLRIRVPMPAVREQLYAAVARLLAERADTRVPLSLQELGRLAGQAISGLVDNADNVAYRICYGLFRSKAFFCRTTADAFNPDVYDLAVPVAELDERFISNTRKSFEQDRYNGLPFDLATFTQLLAGEGEADPQTASLLEDADGVWGADPLASLSEEWPADGPFAADALAIPSQAAAESAPEPAPSPALASGEDAAPAEAAVTAPVACAVPLSAADGAPTEPGCAAEPAAAPDAVMTDLLGDSLPVPGADAEEPAKQPQPRGRRKSPAADGGTSRAKRGRATKNPPDVPDAGSDQ